MSKYYVDDTALQYFKNKLVNIIPTVNNGTLTIQRNGTSVQTFSANQSSNVVANISVPNVTNPTISGTTLVLGNTLDTGDYYTKTETANTYVAKTNYSTSVQNWKGFTLEIPAQYHFNIYKVCLPGTYTLTYGTDTTELTWGIYDILVYRQTSTLKIMIAEIKNADLTYIEGQELTLSGLSDNIPCIVTKY